MIGIFTRQIGKLGSEEGQALVFVAMVGVVIFLFFAMTMNLSEVINTKIKSQNVADAAALSASAWQARALNIVAGLNANLYDWWISFMFFSQILILWLPILLAACCLGTCMDSPVCIFNVVLVSTLLVLSPASLTGAYRAGRLQDEVLTAFDQDLILQDLPKVVDLNYEFKTNTKELADNVFLYAHNNNGNLFIDPGGTPAGASFVLTRGGVCELIIGLIYHACRTGRIMSCVADWENGFSDIVRLMNFNRLYQDDPSFPGVCFQERVPGANQVPLPYVLMTYDYPSWEWRDPEDILPMTVGVYRQRMPPVLHLWGFGQRRSFNCDSPPLTANNWFPCTERDHYAFASAHAYSQSVNDFYNVLKAMGVITSYAVPLGFSDMDWQPRLFAMEPLQEQGEQSPECGWAAYEDVAAQIGDSLGRDEEDYLRDNVLGTPEDANTAFFLY